MAVVAGLCYASVISMHAGRQAGGGGARSGRVRRRQARRRTEAGRRRRRRRHGDAQINSGTHWDWSRTPVLASRRRSGGTGRLPTHPVSSHQQLTGPGTATARHGRGPVAGAARGRPPARGHTRTLRRRAADASLPTQPTARPGGGADALGHGRRKRRLRRGLERRVPTAARREAASAARTGQHACCLSMADVNGVSVIVAQRETVSLFWSACPLMLVDLSVVDIYCSIFLGSSVE